MEKENSQSTTKKIINLSKQAHNLNKEGRYKAAEDNSPGEIKQE